jgi:hypothetical protein
VKILHGASVNKPWDTIYEKTFWTEEGIWRMICKYLMRESYSHILDQELSPRQGQEKECGLQGCSWTAICMLCNFRGRTKSTICADMYR